MKITLTKLFNKLNFKTMPQNRISKEFIYKGYKAFIVELIAGHRCGYVEIPEGNLFFKKEFNEKMPEIDRKYLEDKPIGKRGIIDLVVNAGEEVQDAGFFFDVHGGITYSRDYLFDYKDSWFYGFDCAHCDDGKDISLMDDKHRQMCEEHPFLLNNGIARTEEYVEEELKRLVDQIIEINDLYNK